jgi:hypothetical protein
VPVFGSDLGHLGVGVAVAVKRLVRIVFRRSRPGHSAISVVVDLRHGVVPAGGELVAGAVVSQRRKILLGQAPGASSSLEAGQMSEEIRIAVVPAHFEAPHSGGYGRWVGVLPRRSGSAAIHFSRAFDVIFRHRLLHRSGRWPLALLTG